MEQLAAPVKKSKIHRCLGTLHGPSKRQKKKIKDAGRDSLKTEPRNLDAEHIKPLKEFLEKHLSASDE
ncbi:MAG: hypothetical protein NC344_08170 [Bacteroidales bacterium]|nr:hypothetical protein [Bacteroidales bacterium]MCM1147790.1 hypothetical protein [Bacteroidales bacterium]MCM1206438.1 hypothetical protein [Bacillota bacterium]MCM1510322.1 hypothetical protein [Clostridium sp.]